MSSIEQSIKQKICNVGIPLSEWNLSIYRGILTGFNEAFIVSGEIKDALIHSDPKSAEIIRPILRGRDIKRYSFSYADLWLIATFPSKHYNIDDYPAVKEHLLSFGIERLEQTGKTHSIGGKTVKARKKTTNKWFETQDSISYWDDFSKQKIIYPETTQGAYFILDNGEFYLDKTCFFMISEYPHYLIATLSSKLFEYAYKHIFSSIELGTSAYQYNKHAFVLLPVIKPSKVDEQTLIQLKEYVDAAMVEKSHNLKQEIIKKIDTIIYNLYDISNEEILHIESIS